MYGKMMNDDVNKSKLGTTVPVSQCSSQETQVMDKAKTHPTSARGAGGNS
jgi:hypothetical protein